MEERLQKYLARCGVASRRRAEELILAGKVDVDGDIVTELGTKVDGAVQRVEVEGTPVKPSRFVAYAVNKPKGVVCTNHDPSGRPRAVDLVPPTERVFPIGRLDEESEGLLLMTNDGELAQQIAHPSFQVPKTYLVQVAGALASDTVSQLRRGVWLSDGRAAAERVVVKQKSRDRATLLITLREGRNRHIRRMLAKLELPVKRLLRVQIGPIRLGTLKKAQWRLLSRDELTALRAGAEFLDRPARLRRPPVRHKARPAAAKDRPAGAKTRTAPTKARPTSSKPRPASPTAHPGAAKPRPASSKSRPASPKGRPASSKSRPASSKGRPATAKARNPRAQKRR